MGFKIESETQDTVTVAERLWLTADKDRVVADGDPEAAFLLVGEGGTITRTEAEQYGVTKAKKAKKDDADAAGDGDAKPLADLTKAELVAHAAALDPPLELDKRSKHDELVAAIEAHQTTGDDDQGADD